MIPSFSGGIIVEWRLKTKIKSLSLLIIFFLGPFEFILFSKTLRHRPQPTPSATPSAEAPGGAVAQNIKAVLLDRRPAPPWYNFFVERVK